jgi:hypothetical protein
MLRNLFTLMLLGSIVCAFPVQSAQAETDLPAKLAAALVLKIASFEKRVAKAGDITVFVVNDSELEQELKKLVGQSIGSSKLAKVLGGDSLPSSPPDIMVIGNSPSAIDAVNYAKSTKTLSMTSSAAALKNGVAVGLVLGENKKPKILLNINTSTASSLKWNPAIMKVAKVVKN